MHFMLCQTFYFFSYFFLFVVFSNFVFISNSDLLLILVHVLTLITFRMRNLPNLCG